MWDERATNLGKIIERERKKKGFSQEEIYRGICTQGELSKIESGQRIPEKLLADALMQRLGRCADTLEAIMSVEEYILFDMREMLQRHFYECNYERNRSLLEKYRRHKAAELPLHRQFLCKYEAVNEYRRHGDRVKCRKELGAALAITFPEWEMMDFMHYCLCSQELHLLILIAYFYLPENEEKAEEILEKTADYLQARYYEEEKVKLYPQCMWLLAGLCKKHGCWEKVRDYTEKGIECLTGNGALPLLKELLELHIKSMEKTGKTDENRSARKDQLESLKAVLKEYADWVLRMDDLSRLHYFYHEEEVSLDYEMIRDMRKNQGISQSEVQSCTQSNLSRIEAGKQSPSRMRVMKIVKELGVKKSYYISRVQAEDYDLYELCHWRNQAGFKYEWDKAREICSKLEANLDMSIPLNRQYIEARQIGDKKIREEIEPEEALKKLEEILRYTMPDYQEEKLRIPSREEFAILNMMATFMRKAGKIEKGLQLRKYILQMFRESRVREEYHTNSMNLLYLSYGEILEANGQIELAEKMDSCGIRLGIYCGKAEMLGKILANLAYVYRKHKNVQKHNQVKVCLGHSYQLCLLMKQTKIAKIVADCYRDLTGEDISDF